MVENIELSAIYSSGTSGESDRSAVFAKLQSEQEHITEVPCKSSCHRTEMSICWLGVTLGNSSKGNKSQKKDDDNNRYAPWQSGSRQLRVKTATPVEDSGIRV